MEILSSVWSFFGWKWVLILPSWCVCMLIGANSPQTFKWSKAGLERIAQKAAAKAKALALKGKA